MEGADARLGLAKEILEVILGLEQETLDRVMRTIRGSENAADVKTNIIRSRIGSRSMKYLRNAVDLARREGTEKHKADTKDDTKDVDLEPSTEREQSKKETAQPKEQPKEKKDVKENLSFKNYLLKELTTNIDLDKPAEEIAKIKQAARMGTDRAAMHNIKASRDEVKAAREADPSDPGKQTNIKLANLRAQIAQLEKRQAALDKNKKAQGGM